jgi:hypothetical protein
MYFHEQFIFHHHFFIEVGLLIEKKAPCGKTGWNLLDSKPEEAHHRPKLAIRPINST